MTTESKIWVVTMPSAYRLGHLCVLGQGQTQAGAMADAYGPKPWPKSARNADCSEMTSDELEQLNSQDNE